MRVQRLRLSSWSWYSEVCFLCSGARLQDQVGYALTHAIERCFVEA